MLTDALDVMRYVKASAGRANLKVVFENEGCPRHDGKTIYLPRPTAHTSAEKLKEMMASTDHEVAHDQFSDFAILQEKGIDCSTSKLGFIWNVVEDSRVNALEADMYPGFRELWDESNPILLDNIAKKTKGSKEGIDLLVRGLIKWDCEVSAPIFPLCELSGSKYTVDDKLLNLLRSFSPRLLECQQEERKVEGTALTYELARDIFIALGGKPEDEEKKGKPGDKPGGKKEGESKGGKEVTPGEGDKEKVVPEKGAKEEGETSEEDGAKDDSEDDWCIKKIKLTADAPSKLLSTHDTTGSRMSKVGLLYDVGGEAGSWTMTPPDQFIVVNYSTSTITGPAHGGRDVLDLHGSHAEFFENSLETRVSAKVTPSENFAQQVRRLIQIRSKVRYEYGVKKGKLDYPRLSRLTLNQPGFSDRVFKNKINNTVLDAAVTVLIDMSGSMGGMKVLYAAKAALLLNNVFQVIQVPLEILGFTDDSNETPIMYVYKPFSKAKVPETDLLKYIGASSAVMSGNPDGDCIAWAYNRLLKRKEKRRLLIVMSDGQPCACRSESGLSYFTRTVIQEIEKMKKVEIYGLGLCDDSVRDYYKFHSTVTTPEAIPHTILGLIEQKLLN